MHTDITIMNNIYQIKKLFTEAYYDYRFSSLFIPTLNNMFNMVTPKINRIEYNDNYKYIEIEAQINSNNSDRNLGSYAVDALVGFITFCYDDHIMREILTNINLHDFKIFDNTMKAIREAKALGIENKVINERYLVLNIFNIINFNYNLIRINLT